jgi:hypothetical protein
MSVTVWYSGESKSRAESSVRIDEGNLDKFVSLITSLTAASIVQADLITSTQLDVEGQGCSDTELIENSLKIFSRDSDGNKAGIIVPAPLSELFDDAGKYTGDMSVLEQKIKEIYGEDWFLSYVGFSGIIN